MVGQGELENAESFQWWHQERRQELGVGVPKLSCLRELFQMLKDDAVKVLHSICQQIWETQQWPQDWKRLVFIPVPKKAMQKKKSSKYSKSLYKMKNQSRAKLKMWGQSPRKLQLAKCV